MKNPLGGKTVYTDRYDPTLLFPIERAASRAEIGIDPAALPFEGYDLWNCYELSWLDPQGKPIAAIGEMRVHCASPSLVESKSLKLYLNSFNNSIFESHSAVRFKVESDLSKLLNTVVTFDITDSTKWLDKEARRVAAESLAGGCIDTESRGKLEPESHLRIASGTHGRHRQYSHLLRTLCPVTGQPDWGSVHIEYEGARIEERSLLAFIVSLRNHQGFHEECCERIFVKIMQDCRPGALAVACLYTRRGGIDINPLRTTPGFAHTLRLERELRQ